MLKRILGCLCAVLLLLTPVLCAFGEAVQEESSESKIAVFYMNGTRDGERIKTARYVLNALNARWPERSDKIFARTDVAASIKNGVDNSLYNPGGSKRKLEDMASAKKGETFPNGSEAIKNEALLQQLSAGTTDLWLIVPQESSENLCRNQPMANQMATILANPQSHIHLILIGENARTPSAGDAFSNLAATYPGQVEWFQLASAFQGKTADSNADVHTGDYFLAWLYGEPVDLAVESAGDAGDTWTFTLPENGSIFALQQQPFGTSVAPELYKEGESNARSTERLNVTFTAQQNDANNFVGILAKQLPAGGYVLRGCREQPKVYWYPNLEDLNPTLDMGEETWRFGDHTATISMQNILHREDFTVYFNLAFDNGQSTQFGADNHELNSDNNRYEWQYSFPVDSTKTQVRITPEASLRMADGNLIWTWKGEEQIREMEVTGIETKEDAEQEITLYYTAESSGSVTRNWSDYFEFSSADNPQFDIKPDESITKRGIRIQPTTDGFTLTIPEPPAGESAEAEENPATEGTLTLTAWTGTNEAASTSQTIVTADNAASEANAPEAGAEADNPPEAAAEAETPEPAGNVKSMTLILKWSDAEQIPQEITFERSSDGGKAVSVGKEATLTATIPQETLAKWREAQGQLSNGFYNPDALSLHAEIPLDNREALKDTVPFTDNNGTLKATITIKVPENLGTAEIPLNAQVEEIKQQADPDAGTEEEIRIVRDNGGNIRIENNPPGFTATHIKQKAEIRLDGMPGKYTAQNLFDKVLSVQDTAQLFALFKDPETGKVNTVTLSISHPAGLKLNEEPLPTDKDPWTVPLEADEMLPVIEVTEPGNHEITLTASDGVNESEPFTVKLKAYSGILQIALYAGIGLAAILLLLVAFLVIRQIRKPAFDNIKIRCLVSSDENAESGREILTKCSPTSLAHFEKKGVTLTDVLILTRQPALSAEAAAAADDIIILPTKHDELNILFGKKAMEQIGRHEKREILPQGNICRLRIDNAYIQIENVQ